MLDKRFPACADIPRIKDRHGGVLSHLTATKPGAPRLRKGWSASGPPFRELLLSIAAVVLLTGTARNPTTSKSASPVVVSGVYFTTLDRKGPMAVVRLELGAEQCSKHSPHARPAYRQRPFSVKDQGSSCAVEGHPLAAGPRPMPAIARPAPGSASSVARYLTRDEKAGIDPAAPHAPE